MSLPRRFSLKEDNSLLIEPVSEIESLRFDHRRVAAIDVPANSEVLLEDIQGKAIEIEAVLEPGSAREAGLCVLRSPDGAEQTRISFFQKTDRRRGNSSLQIDVTTTSLRSDVWARTPETGPLKLEEGESLRLRIFVDRSDATVIESQ